MNVKTFTAIPTTVLIAAALAGALTGCSGTTQTATTPAQSAVAVTTPAASSAPTPVTPSATPTTDPYSQTIAGVTYKGSQAAPVRIGTDTPGQAPASDTGTLAANARISEHAAVAGKYEVVIAQVHGKGWVWKIFGPNQVSGDRSELANSGYDDGAFLPSKDAALEGPFTVAGRTLDRAEYILELIAG